MVSPVDGLNTSAVLAADSVRQIPLVRKGVCVVAVIVDCRYPELVQFVSIGSNRIGAFCFRQARYSAPEPYEKARPAWHPGMIDQNQVFARATFRFSRGGTALVPREVVAETDVDLNHTENARLFETAGHRERSNCQRLACLRGVIEEREIAAFRGSMAFDTTLRFS